MRYLATVDEGCEINYCAKIQADFQAKPPNLPPFRSKPGVQKNITQSLVIQGPYGQMWVRDSTGNWVKVAGPILNGDQLLKYLSNAGNESGGGIIPVPNSGQDPSAVSAGAAAGISVVVTLILCSTVVAAVFGAYTLWKKNRSKRNITEPNYLEINGENDGERRILSSFAEEEPDHTGEAEA